MGLNKVGLNYETFRNSKILLHCIPQQVDIHSTFAYGSNFEDKFIVQKVAEFDSALSQSRSFPNNSGLCYMYMYITESDSAPHSCVSQSGILFLLISPKKQNYLKKYFSLLILEV